jgi:hypothetical protein
MATAFNRSRLVDSLAVLTATAWMAAALSGAATREAQATPAPAKTAKTWIGRADEIEAYLRTARIVRTEGTDRGVTKPVRAFFESGGPVASMTWKALPPGRSNGFQESYKAEIASYEIDRLLKLNMVPPKVEREMDGRPGVAVMWVEPARTFADLGGVPTPPPQKSRAFNVELIRAKMFHNLVGDLDPNLGNWLVDPAWHVILIDQSRALTTDTALVHEMQRVDRALWTRMRALTEQTLTQAVSRWLDRDQIRAVIARRDRMKKAINRLLREKGAKQVYVR